MWEEMFGSLPVGSNFNTLIQVDVLRKSFIMFDLFDEVELNSKFRKKLIRTLKFDSNTVDEMFFIDNLILFNEDNVFDLTKLRNRFHIDSDFILDTIKHFNLDEKLIKSFITFSDIGFITDGNELLKQGFKGKEIEIEKRRLETERFISEFI
jgi:hypothetical protein